MISVFKGRLDAELCAFVGTNDLSGPWHGIGRYGLLYGVKENKEGRVSE